MNQQITRKPRATCVLKRLSSNQQAALFEYSDGIGDETGHTYAECVKWLAQQKVSTNPTQLCNWRQWYILRLRMQWCQNTVEMMIEDDKKNGHKYTDDQIQRKGNRIFSLLAIHTCDDKAWSRAQSLVLRRQRITLMERKMELEIKKYEDECAKFKGEESEPPLTPAEKDERIRQIMGTE